VAGGPHDNDPLAVDPETMRELGYRTIDLLVERLQREEPPIRRATPAEMRERLHGPAPDEAEPFAEILAGLDRNVLPFASRDGHPGFFGFIPFAGPWPGALGDLIASACNLYAGSWMEAAGVSQVELEVLGWFKEWIGFPSEAAGSLVSGGSAGNLTALACAREALAGPMRDDLVLYVSDQAHSSIARAARLLGFRPEQVRVLPSDASFRLAPRTLGAAMDADQSRGLTPFAVAAQAGTTNTGAVDPLDELATLCHERGAWLHVDGAYGGFLALTERGRAAMPGLELADTLVLDAHKSLYCPLAAGIVFARAGGDLEQTFTVRPEYLKDMDRYGGVNFADRGVELSRPFRALKVWLTVKTFGLAEIRAALDRSLDLALLAAELITESPRLELVTGPSLGVVNFRSAAGVTVEDMVANVVAAGAFISATTVAGERTARICALGHRSDEQSLRSVIEAAAAAH